MKPLLLLLTLSLPLAARAQFGLPVVQPNAERPAIATPQIGLSVLNDKGEIQSICPLERTDVKSDIAGNLARVVVVQRFSNPSKTPIEALYTFPLPHDAAVDGMTFQVGERTIVGEIKKREEAAQVYAQARAAGRNAALLDQERPNIFSQRVANILSGQQIRVEIALTQPIVYRAGAYEWEFPTVVGPRYVTNQTPDAEKITPPITPEGTKAGHDLTMQVHLQSAVALGEISSALHPITIERSGASEANIALKEGATLPNKDFVLRFAPRDNALQTGLVTRSDGKGGGWFQLVVQPPTQAATSQIARKEMVFVIDQTGSQAGAPIAKAKETMRYCIQNLNAGDTFQLLGFNTDVYPCFPAPVEATPDNIAKALAYLEPLQGGGGTDILKATDYALKMPDDPDRPRIVCFMTDGYVGNDVQIMRYVREHRQSARMFPFGVGNSVNRFLIDGMAREGRGVAEYAFLNEDGQKLAARFYNRVAKPVLLDVKTDWNGLPVAEVFPKIVPDVYESGPVVLTGRFTRGAAGEIVVKGRAQGKDWARRVPVDFSQADKDGAAGLPSAWARQKIEDLTNTTPTQTSGETAGDLKNQITDVALDYHLMSPYTSFVAVEPTIVNVGGEQKTVEVPTEMADGVSYEGIFGARNGNHVYAGGIAILGSVRQNIAGQSTNGLGLVGLAQLGSFAGQGGGGAMGPMGAPGVQAPAGAPRVDALESRLATEESKVVAPPQLTFAPQILHREGYASYIDNRTGARAFLPSPEEFAKMTPEERVTTLRALKMSEAVSKLAVQTPAAKVMVQLWLSPLADDKAKAEFAAKLKALGWTQSAVLTADKLVLGEISSDKLDDVAALAGVAKIEVPKFK